MDFDVLKAVLAALEHHGVRYAIVGAIALNLHGMARATEDLDLFIDPDTGNVERLKRALHNALHDPDVSEISAADLQGPYPAIQYVPPSGAFHIDILARLGEMFAFTDLETERVRFDDLMVTVVTPRTLYRMKKGTVRPQDHVDAEAVRRRFKLEEE